MEAKQPKWKQPTTEGKQHVRMTDGKKNEKTRMLYTHHVAIRKNGRAMPWLGILAVRVHYLYAEKDFS